MTSNIIVQNEFITIEYRPDTEAIYHKVHRPISGQAMYDAIGKATDFLRDNGITKWLADDRDNGPLSPEDEDWALNVWSKRAISFGWKYWAIVVPTELVAASSMIAVIEYFHSLGLLMRVFSNADEAHQWLASI
jgi:hypothetical protein